MVACQLTIKQKTTIMNRNLIIAASVAAGIAAYLFTSRSPKTINRNIAPGKAHHLTNAFSKAKQHAVNTQ